MEAIQRFKDFRSRSLAKYATLRDNVKKAKKLLSGKQWDKRDDNFISSSRNRVTINVINNQVYSTANSYAAFPFKWFTGDKAADEKIEEFFKVDANAFTSKLAVTDTCAFGLGVMAIGSDFDAEGKSVPVIYAVSDIERVLLDPDSVEMDGSDAMAGALIDYRSRDYIRVHMGEEYVPGKNEQMIVSNASCANLVPIITYFELETDGVHVYTFINEKEQQNAPDEEGNIPPTVIPIHRIPIFPVWGERTWDDDKETYIGLATKSEDIQRIVNYSFTQLAERLSMSPKAIWTGYGDSFKGLEKYYKNAGTGINGMLPANRLANDNKTQLPLPNRVDNQVQYADVFGIVQGSLGLLSSITGVDSKGLADVETDVTATAVEYTAKVFKNNVRHYFEHLKTSFKAMGETLMQLWGFQGVRVDVIQGPDDYMELQIARAEIHSLMQGADPAQKNLLTTALLECYPNNKIMKKLLERFQGMKAPTAMEQQSFETIEQMKLAIEQKDQKIEQLEAVIENYQKSSRDFDKGIVADFLKMEQQHNFKLEENAQKAALDAGADAGKAQLEAQKAGLEVEDKAVQLEADKVKFAADVLKAGLGGVV